MIEEADLEALEAHPADTTFRDVQILVAEVRRLQLLYLRYRRALETIHREYGKVCPEFETCTHPSCESSVGAWFEADNIFRAEETHAHVDRQHRDRSEPG